MHNTIRDRVRFIPNDGCESEVARANEKTAFANIILAAACNFRSVLPADREEKKNRHEFGLRVRGKVDPVRWPALNLVG